MLLDPELLSGSFSLVYDLGRTGQMVLGSILETIEIDHPKIWWGG